jgi:exosortase/archaeosortase family protein
MEFFVFDSHISAVTYVGIIHGLIIMIYNFVPLRYSEERDFGLLFFSFFVLTYLLPHAIYKISNSSAGTTDELGYMEYELVYFLLSKPLVLILNALNVPSYVAPSLGTVILFANLETGTMSTVGITSGCSGIYSIYIFTCAFLSFYLLKFKTFNFEGFLFLFSGIFIAYVCNLIRMTLVVLSGHYWGMDALEFTHANLGWIIFSFWFFVFWIFFDRYFFSKMEGLLNE